MPYFGGFVRDHQSPGPIPLSPAALSYNRRMQRRFLHAASILLGCTAGLYVATHPYQSTHAQQAPSSLSLAAQAPQGITQGSASACSTCTGGGQAVYYYVIVRYPAGLAFPVNGIITAHNTAGIGNLSASNYNVITWGGVSGATGYDVIRQPTPGSPTSPCTGCAVVLNTHGNSINDTGQNGGNYPPNLPSVQNVSGQFSIDNSDSVIPRLVYNMTGAPSYFPAMVLGPTTPGQAAIFNADGSVSGGVGGGGGTIPVTGNTLKGDGAGNAAAVGGSATDCVHVNGGSAPCPGGGATIPSTTNVIVGDGAGNGADSKVAITSPATDATIQFSADHETVVLPGGTLVPNSRTVCGHALSGNVACTASDVGLGSVTDDAQTKAAVVPNTAPAAGGMLLGNAGGTAYGLVPMSGNCTILSTGAISCLHAVTFSFDGGGSAISTGACGQFQSTAFSGTINRIDIGADQTGSFTLDIWKANAAIPTSGDKISASAPITLATQQISQSGSLTGWSTSVAVNDVFGCSIATAATVTKVTATIWFQ